MTWAGVLRSLLLGDPALLGRARRYSHGASVGLSVAVSRRSQLWFLLLVIVQTMHSIEEYATELYLNLASARYVSGLISEDLGLGFAFANTLIVGFGLWCYFVPIRAGFRAGAGLATSLKREL